MLVLSLISLFLFSNCVASFWSSAGSLMEAANANISCPSAVSQLQFHILTSSCILINVTISKKKCAIKPFGKVINAVSMVANTNVTSFMTYCFGCACCTCCQCANRAPLVFKTESLRYTCWIMFDYRVLC